MRTDDLLYAPGLSPNSVVRTLEIRDDHLLLRPYSPKGKTKGGLWLERNPYHVKIWGWVIAIPRELLKKHPQLVPGCMVVFNRWQGEPIEKEPVAKQRYIGQHHVVMAMPIEGIQLALNPPLVPMEDARASKVA